MERVPVHSEEAEQGALGAILLEPERLIRVAVSEMGVKPEAFYVPACRLVYEAVLEMADGRARAIDVLTVSEHLGRQGRLENVGGQQFLERLVDATPTAAHGEYYLDIVRQKAILRGGIAICREQEQAAYRAELGDAFAKASAEKFLALVGDTRQALTNAARMDAAVERWRKAKSGEKAIGLQTPWGLLDELTCGLEVGLTLLAARPSQGKTTMEDQLCCYAAGQGIPVGRITLDSTADELLQRALCRLAGVSLPKLKFGFAGERQLGLVEQARDTLGDYPMLISDTDRELRQICATARAWKMRHDIQLLTLDFIQLVNVAEMGRSQWDRNTRVTYVSGMLKSLSLELGIPILALSQLRRFTDGKSREPELEDLRDSGSLEQDAHKVLFLYRYDKKAKAMDLAHPGATKKKRPAWADVQKHKDGQTGRVALWLRPHYFRFDQAQGEFEDDELPGREKEHQAAGELEEMFEGI